MLKIAFALQVIVLAAFGLGGTSTTSTEQKSESVARMSCSVCAENYDNCISDGIAPSTCQRLETKCLTNCLP